jgi:hypothetical protein
MFTMLVAVDQCSRARLHLLSHLSEIKKFREKDMVDKQFRYDTPDWFPLKAVGSEVEFVRMDRAAYERSIFCDHRISTKNGERRIAPWSALEELADLCPVRGRSPNFVFHIAHCGSTLLARALDRPGRTIVIREPYILRELAVAAAVGKSDKVWRYKVSSTSRLLSRRYGQESVAIVKANVPVNFILQDLLAVNDDPASIALYYPLEKYLIAVLRSADHQRWVSGVVNELKNPILKLAPVWPRTIAEAAASLWFAQIAAFQQALGAYENLKSLNAAVFLAAPGPCLAAAFSHFGVAQSADEIAAIATSDLFKQYSKDPSQSFSKKDAAERDARLRERLARPLNEAQEWVRRLDQLHPLASELARPLTGEASPLIAG